MTMTRRILAYVIRFLSKPVKWLSGLLFALLIFTFIFFLLSGNPLLTFIDDLTLRLAVGSLASIILHIMMDNVAERLLDEDYTFPSYSDIRAPQFIQKPTQKSRKTKKKHKMSRTSTTGKVVQMSDWR